MGARGSRRSRGLAVLVASEDALDQFFAREPDTLLSRRVEAAILDHANHRILDPHVLSAAFEAPLDEADAETLGAEALRRAAVLPELERTSGGYVWKGRDYPAARISLRSGDGEAFSIVDAATGSLLGLVERERAYSTVHEGAVYLHLGEQYLVEQLDHDGRVALVATGERRLVHAGEEGDRDDDRGVGARRAQARRRSPLRTRVRLRAGDRIRAEVDPRRRDDRRRPAADAGDDVRDRGDLVLARSPRCSRTSTGCRSCSARSTPPSTR